MSALLVSLLLLGTQAAEYKPVYERRANHDPNGIGIFYMGREIAQVMGHEGAAWLDRPERTQEEAPDLLLKALKLKPGMNVADIGAGSGYFTLPMARQVFSADPSKAGRVFAVEIQQEMLDIIDRKAKQAKVTNIAQVLGTTTDPKLPRESIDLILMVDVYHEFDKPYEMVRNMIPSLRQGGKVVFVEYRGEDPSVPIKEVHKMTIAQLRKEMSVHPLRWVGTNNSLPWQHIVTFEKI